MHAVLRRRCFAAWLVTSSFAAHSARAADAAFVWGFQTFNGTQIQECARLQIYVGPSTAARPPYTLIAYEVNGFPTVQTVGSDVGNLWWDVDHTAGARLVMSMVDGAGNPGGVSSELYTVTTSSNATCHSSNTTSPISITTNTTQTLKSCDILPLKISGGQKPYTITIAALNSTSTTNISMGVYDQFNWINRVTPGSQLIATASDATGTYAAATALLSATGSSDLTCNGRESTLIDSTGRNADSKPGGNEVPQKPSPPSSNRSSSSRRVIIGGIVAGVVLIGVLLFGLLFFLRKRRTRAKGPRQYLDGDSQEAFGLGKAGGAVGQSGYLRDPIAEEITPFVTPGGQPTPYRDYDPRPHSRSHDNSGHYNQASYSTAGADTLVDVPSQPDQHDRFTTVSQLPSGAAALPMFPGATSQPTLTSTFDPYDSRAATGVPAAPLTYATPAAQPSAQPLGARVGSVSGSAAGPVAGGSASTGLPPIGTPTNQEVRHPDAKRGARPSQPAQAVYQHEDVADVEELPPAYKERTA